MISSLYQEAVDKWGKEHQLLVTVEEMAEATASIAQFVNRGRNVEEDVIEELADVYIMIRQVEIIYGARFTKAICKKLNKLKGHLDAT